MNVPNASSFINYFIKFLFRKLWNLKDILFAFEGGSRGQEKTFDK